MKNRMTLVKVPVHYASDEGFPNACSRQGPQTFYVREVTCKDCLQTELFLEARAEALTRVLSAQGWIPS